MRKAIVLFSGGLDSIIACKLLQKNGWEVVALFIDTGFVGREIDGEIERKIRDIADEEDIRLIVVDAKNCYFQEVLLHPRFGYGKGANPCIDCRIFMMNRAKELKKEIGADVIATGEVLGQRPMTQNKNTFRLVEKKTGIRILRPLSEKLLNKDSENWCLNIQGRGMKRQIELKEKLNMASYLPHAGGCILTEEVFSHRFKELLKNEESIELSDAILLEIGRHFRLPSGTKVVLARDERECKYLQGFCKRYVCFFPAERPGAIAVAKKIEIGDEKIIVSLIAYYSKKRRIKVNYCLEGKEYTKEGEPFSRYSASLLMI
jgi:hypothetical protein